MFNVLFTLDYEIHGSGRGSPRRLMVKPTERLLRQLDGYGAKLTILADVAEILKFREHWEEHGEDRFCYQSIADQLRRAVAGGHDVQLHLHSSYANATWSGDHWRQDYTEYDLARLSAERLDELIGAGKRYLEQLLTPVRPDYRCYLFRAANWSMQPSAALVRALVDHGITVDTSVFKHGVCDELVRFDYRSAHSDLLPWPVDHRDICRRDPNGALFELPIYCEPQPIWTFLTLNRIYRVFAQRLNPLAKMERPAPTVTGAGRGGSPSPWRRARGALARLTTPQPWKMDFNQCTGRQLIGGLRRAERRYGHLERLLPFVLIGHSKTYTRLNAASLGPFLRFVAGHPDRFRFGTCAELDLESFRRL